MEDIKRIEGIVKKCRIEGFNIIARKNGWPTNNKWDPIDANGIADLKSLVLAYQKGEADARSKDTDLIKEAHKVIGMLLASKDCWTNGEPEIIQEISAQFDLVIDDAQMIIDVTKRINDRSK